jgi:hypothetical protein
MAEAKLVTIGTTGENQSGGFSVVFDDVGSPEFAWTFILTDRAFLKISSEFFKHIIPLQSDCLSYQNTS